MIRGDLYEWVGVDRFGKSTTYQTHGPDVSESSMLEHLRRHYPGLRITSLKRVGVGEFRPQAEGEEVQSHAFMRGIRDAAVDALGELSDERRREFLYRDVPRGCEDMHQVNAWYAAAELLLRRREEEAEARPAANAPRPSVLESRHSVVGEARRRNRSVLRPDP